MYERPDNWMAQNALRLERTRRARLIGLAVAILVASAALMWLAVGCGL